MVAIVNRKETTLQHIEDLAQEQKLRPYLGMSQLGHSCDRYLWYSFRWCFKETISERMQRLFGRGHREEPVIVDTLNKVGVHVYDDQLEAVAVHGHCKGHIDGKAIGVIEAPKTVHLAEFKTMSDKYFKEVCKKGVKQSKPIYYGQAQCYMGEFKLTRCLFVAVNKNDDSMYIERIYFDATVHEKLMARAEHVILSEEPPPKPFKPTWYECRWCSARDICHGSGEVEGNCRTCNYCDILNNGNWECSKLDIPLTTSQQRLGCKHGELLESLQD